MRGKRRGRYTGRPGRRLYADWRVQALIIGATCLLLLLVYFKGQDDELPATLLGRADVIDGDTITIGGRRVRLNGIDAPEYDQTCADQDGKSWACGKAATRELAALVKGRDLTCRPIDFDKYDRVLAVCSLPDGSDVNLWMLRQGWAVTFGTSRLYASEETKAKAAKRGLWAGTFERPSEWRERTSD